MTTPAFAILPGELLCARSPAILTTLLGSCVTVCLWDHRRGIGGMNHFVLPTDPAGSTSARYGDVAMEQLTDLLLAHGAVLADMRAKLFGGAAVLPTTRGHSVGDDNVDFAVSVLKRQRIPIAARRTGGTSGRQLRFHTWSGEAMVRDMPRSEAVLFEKKSQKTFKSAARRE